MSTAPAAPRPPRWRIVASGLVPLVLLAGMVTWFLGSGTRWLNFGHLPVEKLAFGRVMFRPQEIVFQVRNEGPTPFTIAQVFVNEAIWDHAVVPGRVLPRLQAATIYVPYDWQVGEPYVITVVSGTGVRHVKQIGIAAETPRLSFQALGVFGLLGVYVGVIPILLGFLWLPFMRSLAHHWMEFWLSFTAGLLVFLGIDTFHEALEILQRVPELFNGLMLIVLGGLGAFLGLIALDASLARRRGPGGDRGPALALMIALGIGLHNLGEGLAIGAAYTLGEVALGAFLIVGFTVHNTTEGLAILSPLVRARVTPKLLAWLGVLAGVPTVFGSWIGVFTYSDPLSLLFLGLGGGAIFQVVWIIFRARIAAGGGFAALASWPNASGLLAGFLAMYVTSLLVAS
jgi:zinc transporter, ZIP family